MISQHDVMRLREALHALYNDIEADPASASERAYAAQALASPLERHSNLHPQQQPVCRYLNAALEQAGRAQAAALAAALRPILHLLRWETTYAWTPALDRFLQNYAWTDLIGPPGLLPSDQLTVGLLLMGPMTFYPAHDHPAVELYHVLAGLAQWQRGTQPFHAEPPGAWILHPSSVPHAMQTTHEPLLALYLWHGALNTPATWSAR